MSTTAAATASDMTPTAQIMRAWVVRGCHMRVARNAPIREFVAGHLGNGRHAKALMAEQLASARLCRSLLPDRLSGRVETAVRQVVIGQIAKQ